MAGLGDAEHEKLNSFLAFIVLLKKILSRVGGGAILSTDTSRNVKMSWVQFEAWDRVRFACSEVRR